ncbi:gas vesicle protein [Lysinibacillus sp. 2017]|uniref:YtxH domain-containing protein n=1 Tax=unclassified Lysinibacillus TaxID=2636778 RepID=UPI000D525B04|nr:MULTISPECIES: YtxH domain-containing protein [unclassified Lysinibacillus]AWE08673.1 gas vesicle protein [Lysinibacillus sp. 2017]TGN35094.1 YtxH domain-containing protein [Lysinibacillus sp. S2017]
MKAKSFLLGLTTGVISGAAVVLFSAPQSGEQLRQTISSSTAKAKLSLHDVKSELQKVKASISTLKAEAQNNIPSIINELKGNLTTFKQEIEPETLKLKQEIESLQNSIKEIEKNIPSDKNNA